MYIFFSSINICFDLETMYTPSGDFCSLLITFANSLNPDQKRQNVGPDVDPSTLLEFLEELFEIVNFGKKVSRR